MHEGQLRAGGARELEQLQPYELTLDKFLAHAAKWHPQGQVVTGGGVGGPVARIDYAALRERSTLLSGAFIACRWAGGGGTSGALGIHMRGITFPAGRYFSGHRRSKSAQVVVGIIGGLRLCLVKTPLDKAAMPTGPLLLLPFVDLAPFVEAVEPDPAILVHRFRSA